MNNTEQVAFGQYGSKIATNSAAEPDNGVFVALTALTDATLVSDTTAETGFTCPVSVSIPAGVTIYGRWTKVVTDDSANKVLCYEGK